MSTPRLLLTLHVRAFPGWSAARQAIASAFGLPLAEVRGLTDAADPALRLEALDPALGFGPRLAVYGDPARLHIPPLERLAPELTRRLGVEIAHLPSHSTLDAPGLPDDRRPADAPAR